jgi:phage terminase small subunit
MPILANPKHEAFAQGLARGSSATAAYVEAGYKCSSLLSSLITESKSGSTWREISMMNLPKI